MPVDLLRDGLLRLEHEAPPPSVEAQDPDAEPPPTRRPPEGACALCGERPAAERCVHCERAVCADEYWVMFGLCRECLTEDEMRRAHEERRRPRPDLGIKWIED